MTVFVTECYRPAKDHDQMLMFVNNINYVTNKINEPEWLENMYIHYYRYGNERHKIIANSMNLEDLAKFINDFVFHHKIPQPCNLSIYAMDVYNVRSMGLAIRDILEHNRIV